ncbi:MAG TPA: hypothetical protein VMV92_37615 [Streptosporangiaceae bacterium]|nr:hypothetical protein [Streptosporangiaceae bacterium]
MAEPPESGVSGPADAPGGDGAGEPVPELAGAGAVVIRAAPGQTTSQLRAAVHQAVLWVDSAAARRRKEAAQRQARVELWREDAGTCALAGRDLPAAFALAADKCLSAAAGCPAGSAVTTRFRSDHRVTT